MKTIFKLPIYILYQKWKQKYYMYSSAYKTKKTKWIYDISTYNFTPCIFKYKLIFKLT